MMAYKKETLAYFLIITEICMLDKLLFLILFSLNDKKPQDYR
jgi:hypothetical protein